MKKILSLLIFSALVLSTVGCLSSYANADLEAQKRETREKIKESSQKAYDKAQSAVKEIQEKAETITLYSAS